MSSVYDINGNVMLVDSNELKPNLNDIPIVSFLIDGNLPQSKAAGEAQAKIFFKSESLNFNCFATMKVQGSSSASYPKKNYTIKLFDDDEYTKKRKIVFKDWKSSNKYVIKANWIDHSHSRNIVNARLWDQIMRSRSDFETLPKTLQNSHLSVDGFPIKVYANGIYQGLYTWNIPKSALYGIDDKVDEQALVESNTSNAEIFESCYFRTSTNYDENWGDETHDEMPSVISTGWNRVLNFVYTSSDSSFVSDYSNYIDKQTSIDAYIMIYLACIVDNIGKNQYFFTYDANKWYQGMYDLDGTWGNPCWLPAKSDWYLYNTPFQTGYTIFNGGGSTSNLLYERLENLMSNDIRTRYEELRNSVLSEDNILGEFDKFIHVIPPYLYAEDYAETTANGAYINVPLKESNNILQIREFVNARCAYVDSMILGS